MSFKQTIPYFLTSAAMMFIGANTLGRTEKESLSDAEKNLTYKEVTIPETKEKIDSCRVIANANYDNSVVVKAVSQKYDVVYTRANGNQFRRSGGTRAWRNNNPGCVRYSVFMVSQGAIGEAGGFAVFPDEETGMKAIGALLKSDKYKNLTISQAISKYAPPHENDTDSYNANLSKITGLPVTKRISELNNEQLMQVVKAIRIVEGWRSGTETIIPNKSTLRDSLDFYASVKNKILEKSFEHTI